MEPVPSPTPTEPVTPPAEPTPSPTQPAAAQPALVHSAAKGLAITALVLSIVSLVFSFVWFIMGPIAIAAVILAIVSLVKKHGGKGMSIASLIIGGVTLVIAVPFWILISFIAYGGILNAAQQQVQTQPNSYSESSHSQQLFN